MSWKIQRFITKPQIAPMVFETESFMPEAHVKGNCGRLENYNFK